jgi:uncharacterized protein (DUF3084 family)
LTEHLNLQERDAQIAALVQELANRDYEIRHLKQQILNFEQSMNWWIIRPLRALNYYLKKRRHLGAVGNSASVPRFGHFVLTLIFT